MIPGSSGFIKSLTCGPVDSVVCVVQLDGTCPCVPMCVVQVDGVRHCVWYRWMVCATVCGTGGWCAPLCVVQVDGACHCVYVVCSSPV